MTDPLAYYTGLWNLREDGELITTRSSLLQPVIFQDRTCMLKIALGYEERAGNKLMEWWNGLGAAPVLRHDENAILMKRAMGRYSLAEMVKNGRDEEASRIICSVIAKLNAHPKPYPECLVPLTVRFKSLRTTAERQGGIFQQCLKIAEQLLPDQKDVVVLHGDIHHANILDFGERDWLAIDPKGLVGERGFDYANLFCNPNRKIATAPGRLERQVKVVSEAACIEPERLLQWVAAWCGLSAAWSIEDDEDPETALTVADIALNKLDEIN